MKAGVDEAGRGPVLGPLVMAIVQIDQKQAQELQKAGVKDSKEVPFRKRTKLARLIKAHCQHVIIKVLPTTIDKAVATQSLNTLEAKTTAKLIAKLAEQTPLGKIMLDLPTKNKETYCQEVKRYLSFDIDLDAKHKADQTHIAVAAASIIAKDARDRAISNLEKKYKIRLGSGYPADPVTQQALQNHLPFLEEKKIARLSWKTVKNLKERQTTMLQNGMLK